MAFGFDLEAAVGAIAALELAINTPAPGVVTAYGYGNNPAEIVDVTVLPAVVHIPLGPVTAERLTLGKTSLIYDIVSIMLISEAIKDDYPVDEKSASAFWISIANTFFNSANVKSLQTSASANTYTCLFDERSYQVRHWPPPPATPLHWYWSYRYIHRFTTVGP